jgi:aspartyl-tRNA(Asn)/glutamyl-tRNA(Gln) amidotransferase subunit B
MRSAGEEVAVKFEVVIGLEVHAQLLTRSKIFCSCSTVFGGKPNAQTCPICLGMPGVLPALNKHVVALAMKTALATNCQIAPASQFARKNYFYPDLPKGYQISQYEQPLATDGFIEIEVGEGGKKKIGITRIHMEEDAGKLLHELEGAPTEYSYVDFNRTGVPLMEIVSVHTCATCGQLYSTWKSVTEIWKRGVSAVMLISLFALPGKENWVPRLN